MHADGGDVLETDVFQGAFGQAGQVDGIAADRVNGDILEGDVAYTGSRFVNWFALLGVEFGITIELVDIDCAARILGIFNGLVFVGEGAIAIGDVLNHTAAAADCFDAGEPERILKFAAGEQLGEPPLRPCAFAFQIRDVTLLESLQKTLPKAKKQTLKEMVQHRRVLVNDRPAAKLSQSIGPDDVVRVLPRAANEAATASLDPLRLVFEDAELLVIDKPAGLLTSTVASEKRPTALAIVRRYVQSTQPTARVGLIHRLDRDASGLLVFSKSHRAYESLKTQFFKHTVERIYEATVQGKPKPPAGSIRSRLIERADGTVYSTKEHAKGQVAMTHYEVLSSEGKTSVLRVRLQTGRKHQIRVHLSERGWPIVGDAVYGKSSGKLMLRAVRLALEHPVGGKRMAFEVPRT